MNFAHLAFFLVGVGYLIYGCFCVRKVRRMRSWPSVPAELVNADVQWEALGQSLSRTLRLSYRYTVAGREFTSSRITVSDFWLATGEIQIRYIFRRHVRGGARAYYDPLNPASAVLVRPGFTYPLSMFVMAAATIGVAVLAPHVQFTRRL